MDEYGYPDEEEFKIIKEWNPDDPIGLLDYVKKFWWMPSWGWKEVKKRNILKEHEFYISTGGWSGNEGLINAMKANSVFWELCCRDSRPGGHYTLVVSKRFSK